MAIIGPPAKRRLNGVLMAKHFSGDLDQNCKETLYFCDFSGGGCPDPRSPLLIRTCVQMHPEIFYILKQSLSIFFKVYRKRRGQATIVASGGKGVKIKL